MRTPRRMFVFLTMLLSLPPMALAQTSGGRILGVAEDTSGGILPGGDHRRSQYRHGHRARDGEQRTRLRGSGFFRPIVG